MIILYGFRDRDIEVKSGAFDCPGCRKRRFCKHRKIESWLALFFIPVCPWRIRTEYSKCDHCRQSFESSTLQPFLPAGGYLRSELRGDLQAGASLEAVMSRLVESGVDSETAASVIGEIAGNSRGDCPTCGFTYLSCVPACNHCGGQLVKSVTKGEAWLDELA